MRHIHLVTTDDEVFSRHLPAYLSILARSEEDEASRG